VYYTNWSQYRQCNKFFPEDILPIVSRLTHINYAFAKIDTGGNIIPIEWNDCVQGLWPGCQGFSQTLYDRINALKTRNPSLKTLISIGGWSWGGVIACPAFTGMARTASTRANFISQAIRFARVFNWDGIDIDWEYPGATDLGCSADDAPNFLALMREFRAAINAETVPPGKSRLLLTIASPAGIPRIDAMRLVDVAQYLDFINVMSYDLHGAWDTVTGGNAPLRDTGDRLSVTSAINYYAQLGIPRASLNLGYGTYGRTWDASTGVRPYPVGSPARGAGQAGQCTGEPGFMAYYEILTLLRSSGAISAYNTTLDFPYAAASTGNPWVGYDDVRSIQAKTTFARQQGLGGAMVWTIDLDDFPNGSPLITAIANGWGTGGTAGSVTTAIFAATSSSTAGISSTAAVATATTTTTTTASTTSSTTGLNCNGRADGMYCVDSVRFLWCPSQIIQSCAPGTVCRQSGNTIQCGFP